MKHKILVVDDNNSETELLTIVLQSLRKDLAIQVGCDGQEALDLLLPASDPFPASPPSFSLILLDIKMPGVDGINVLRSILAQWLDADHLPGSGDSYVSGPAFRGVPFRDLGLHPEHTSDSRNGK